MEKEAISRMHTHRIQIFNGADDDAVVLMVAHHFQFKFFPAFNGLFNQDFRSRAVIKPPLHYRIELFFAMRDAAASATQGKSRANHYGPTIQFFLGFMRLFQRMYRNASRHIEANSFHRFLEKFPVFRLVDDIGARSNHLYIITGKDALFVQLHRQIQSGLATKGGKQRIGSFTTNNFRQRLSCQRFNISAICEIRIRHNGRRI